MDVNLLRSGLFHVEQFGLILQKIGGKGIVPRGTICLLRDLSAW
jgi:hypothetical protein